MIENKKASILLVLKVLEEYSDKDHLMTQQDIIDKIYTIYGIELERKSVSNSIKLLEELNYDIVKGAKGGVALLSRLFDETEASFLIDSIFSSKSINAIQAKQICKSISSCFSKYQRKDYSYLFKSKDINRSTNKDVFYNISIINEAIKNNKKIGFKYLAYDKLGNKTVRKDGYEYIVSPYYLINNYGRYYLLCNYNEKYRPLQVFRIDFIIDINIKNDSELKPFEKLKNIPENFSITKYINEHIYFFSGEVVDATLLLENESAILNFKDWFGELAKIEKIDDKIIAKVRCDENALCYWALQYCSNVKILSPSSLVEKVKENLYNAIKKYGE